MTTKLNVMQQALAALVECRYATTDKSEKLADAAINALESAIAQPTQEGDAKDAKRLTLSDYRIKHGWEQTFSTNNLFCPCNLKSFTKAVNWALEHFNAVQGGDT